MKAYRPCPSFVEAKYKYSRQGQSLNEVSPSCFENHFGAPPATERRAKSVEKTTEAVGGLALRGRAVGVTAQPEHADGEMSVKALSVAESEVSQSRFAPAVFAPGELISNLTQRSYESFWGLSPCFGMAYRHRVSNPTATLPRQLFAVVPAKKCYPASHT